MHYSKALYSHRVIVISEFRHSFIMAVYESLTSLERLSASEFQIEKLANGPVQRSDEWFKARECRITASKLPALLGMWGPTIRSDSYRSLMSPVHGNGKGNSATDFGNAMEESALLSYLHYMRSVDPDLIYKETTYTPHPLWDFAGATPDGRVESLCVDHTINGYNYEIVEYYQPFAVASRSMSKSNALGIVVLPRLPKAYRYATCLR